MSMMIFRQTLPAYPYTGKQSSKKENYTMKKLISLILVFQACFP